jgi:hypothetical protein
MDHLAQELRRNDHDNDSPDHTVPEELLEPDLDGNVRIYVHLITGSKVVVSLPPTATVAQLHDEVVTRTFQHGFNTTINNTVLSTIGRYSAVVHSEDLLEDILDTTEEHSFVLYPLEVSKSSVSTT